MVVSGAGPRRVTIHDVASAAGVSRQTVSRALNDKGEIDGSTKQRVLDAALALGYRPSRFARGLVRQDTTTVGLVIPDLLNPFFTEVASAVLESARSRGWQVVLYDTADSPGEELRALRTLVSQVDAVVGYLSGPEAGIEALTRGLPVVLVGRELDAARFSSIRVDGEAGVRAAIARLAAAGHRRIGMVDHVTRPEPSARCAWFTRALRKQGLGEGPVVRARQSVEGGEEALGALLADDPSVTAVFTYNDVIAVGVLRAARRLGRAVPSELAVVGFDGVRLGAYLEPPLTSVALDTRSLAALALDQIGRQLSGTEPLGPQDLVVRAELLPRESA